MTMYPPGLWAFAVRCTVPERYAQFVEVILREVIGGRRSIRGVSGSLIDTYQAAAAWIVQALHNALTSFPEVGAILPRSRRAYAEHAPPFGCDVALRVVDAVCRLGWAEETRGYFDCTSGKGVATRLRAAGELRVHLLDIGPLWTRCPPAARESLILMGPDGARRIVRADEGPDVRAWQDNLYRFNDLILDKCIYLEMPDAELLKLGDEQGGNQDGRAAKAPFRVPINFGAVELRRIFAQGSLQRGGRFYGGWWQYVPRIHRHRVVIDDSLTAECDFSGMALACLYARIGADPGVADLYDIGLDYEADSRRRPLVKRFVNALLNDTNGTFRLSRDELDVLGLSHDELLRRVRHRHAPLSEWFCSGVGLELQFTDSQIAEAVMLRFADQGEACLSIHDGFLIRRGLCDALQEVMREEFERVTGARCTLKMEPLRTVIEPPAVDGHGHEAVMDALRSMFDARSIAQGYLASWAEEHPRAQFWRIPDDIYGCRELSALTLEPVA